MRTASHLAALRLVDHAAGHGISRNAESWLGVERGQLTQPGRLPSQRMYTAWDALSGAVDDPAVAARAAREWTLERLGLLGFCVNAAPTVRDALETAVRFVGLVTDDGHWQLRPGPGVLRAVWKRPGEPVAGRALSNEMMLVAFARCFELLSGVPPLALHVRHPLRAGVQAHAALIGIEVRARQPEDQLLLPAAALDAVPRGADRALWSFLCGLAERETQPYRGPGAAERVRAQVSAIIEAGEAPDAEGVAAKLGMSERTLRRRLADEGTSLRALIGEARVERAALMLARGDARVGEVALDVGYADASGLGRAFRRRRGVSPTYGG